MKHRLGWGLSVGFGFHLLRGWHHGFPATRFLVLGLPRPAGRHAHVRPPAILLEKLLHLYIVVRQRECLNQLRSNRVLSLFLVHFVAIVL